jgi:N-hydroxyarylamine O-acetyltransferase
VTVDLEGYLDRLGIPAPHHPDLATLRRLHDAHLRRIPFENADVLRGVVIALGPEALVTRLVGTRRGGFCYQLNGAFAVLLASLGFRVDRLPARFHGDRLEPPFGHVTLRVTIDDVAWLVDVGGGYSFRGPLRMVADVLQEDRSGTFRIRPVLHPAPDDLPDSFDVEWRHRDGGFRPHFRFATVPQPMTAFTTTCAWTQTSPDSPFTRGWIAAAATEAGWATLDGRRLRVTGTGDDDIDRELEDGAELAAALDRWFGVSA